jgi:hypothetical protein
MRQLVVYPFSQVDKIDPMFLHRPGEIGDMPMMRKQNNLLPLSCRRQ